MKHNSRCENARPKSKCRCRCGGRFHAINHEQSTTEVEGHAIRAVNENLGGEVARTIQILTDVPFTCTCGKKQVLGDFLGYPHASGLDDKDGNRWWVFYECLNPKCLYQWSWHKLVARLQQQTKLKVK
jgi:hypothetical protein